MADNILKDKSYVFALEIIKTYRDLTIGKKEYVLSKQLLRSGTSIGANIEESVGGQSEKDFYSKLSIAYKEARESNYWIRLLRDSNLLENNESEKLINYCDEIIRIIGKIQSTLRQKGIFLKVNIED
ncbi:four helix bundle protein [Candidatus Shapirobacteria bacterium]|nr:four helix bundle protein [Candidatus Shapirobacteria bacterium]